MTWRFLEAVVVVFAVGQLVRIALKPPFRRDMAAFPATAAVGSWMIIRWPLVLHAAAVASAVALIAAWWRARPGYGRSAGWPPGSLGIGASLDAINDRTFYLDQARIHGPVFKMSQFGRPVLCVVGLSRGRELLHQNAGALTGARYGAGVAPVAPDSAQMRSSPSMLSGSHSANMPQEP